MREHRSTTSAAGDYWMDPRTGDVYPLAYRAYRDKRESEDRWPARHRTLAPDVDHLAWRRAASATDVEVVLTVRPGTPPRVKRIVAAVLHGIRRGGSATDVIRRVARRFGLRHRRARDVIAAGVTYERRSAEAGPRSTAGRAHAAIGRLTDPL